MAITDVASNPDHLQVGKGIVEVKFEGDTDFSDLGEVSELEYELTIDKLDFFSSRAGVRTKARSIVLERGGTLRILMHEMVSQNLSIMLMGDVETADYTIGTCTITVADPAVVTLVGHGKDEGQIVRFSTAGSLPTGLTEDTDYYVRNPTSNNFSVSATPTGSLIATTG